MSPKTAEEWREYRLENRERINANRRKRNLERREAEKLLIEKPLIPEEQ